MVELILIKILGVLVILFSFLVVLLNNLVHSVISLIMVFFCFSGICFVYGFEYIGLMLTIIYIGAIAVLFLFIVLMLNIREKSYNAVQWAILVLFLGVITYFISFYREGELILIDWVATVNYMLDIEVIGILLYARGVLFVIIAGSILLVAMIGSIILTLVHSSKVERQTIFEQNAREVTSVENSNIKVV